MSNIDNIEVSLSNFAGQETVTVKEFLAHAFMVVAEASYHEGYNDEMRKICDEVIITNGPA